MAKKIPTFSGEVSEGKLRLYNQAGFNMWVSSLSGVVEVIVKPFKRTRSESQREYYWAVIVEKLGGPLGLDSPEEVNEWLKDHFNAKVVSIFGKEEQIGMSIENAKSSEVEDIYRRIREWASTVGVFIPEPNENEEWLSGGGK